MSPADILMYRMLPEGSGGRGEEREGRGEGEGGEGRGEGEERRGGY